MSAHSLATPFVPVMRLVGDRPAGRASIGSRRNPASHAAILDAAAALLREAGPAGVTIDAVARRARAGKPTVYRWWPDRLSLFAELHERERPAIDGATIADIAAATVAAWTHTPAGPCVRAIVAESQASPEHRARAVASFDAYRAAIASADPSLDAAATFDAWLAAFLFCESPASVASRMGAVVGAQPVAIDAPTAPIESVRDRRDWVD